MQTAPERRSEARFDVQEGTILMDGEGYPLENWSDGGFSLISYNGKRRPGDEVEIDFLLYERKTMIQLSGRAIIVWHDPSRRRLGGHLVEMDEDSRNRLKETVLAS